MQRWLWTAGMALGILGFGCAQKVLVQPAIDMAAYQRLAVLPFESDSYLSTVGNQLADEIVVDLLQNAPGLDIVERTRIDALLGEQNLAQQGYLSPDTAIKVGRLLGVRAIITGSVSLSIGDIRPTPLSPRRVASGVATMRIIDATTGKVIWGTRRQAEYTAYLGTGDEGYATGFRTDHEMVQEVVRKLAVGLAEAFYPHYELQY